MAHYGISIFPIIGPWIFRQQARDRFRAALFSLAMMLSYSVVMGIV
jgi:hypothetical protein